MRAHQHTSFVMRSRTHAPIDIKNLLERHMASSVHEATDIYTHTHTHAPIDSKNLLERPYDFIPTMKNFGSGFSMFSLPGATWVIVCGWTRMYLRCLFADARV